MEKSMERCPHCYAKMVVYRKKLNKGLCGALIRMYKKLGVNKFAEVTSKSGELKLSFVQYANFQVLAYWGFIKRPESHDHLSKGGIWAVTEFGEKFIKGEVAVPVWKKTYRKKVVEEATDMVKISDVVEGYEDKAHHILGAENVSEF